MGRHASRPCKFLRKSSNHLLLINNQRKFQAQFFRSLPAQDHALHKNFKIIHHRAELGIYRQLQLYQRLLLVDLQLGFLYGIVHPVVDIKGLFLLGIH